jgi:poly(A) polymerase/tRNA nucleotidyltransferase (CCA-adding enzyme)
LSRTSERRVSDFVHSLGLDAYLVGGAVRDELLAKPHKDEDFVVPGVGYDELRAALAPHGRVEDLEVAGQRVGLRLYPRDREVRVLAPAGIEFAPPRTERSTGPGRHDFEIVASAAVPLEDDMRRRDFTINAMAKRLATGELLDPFGGSRDLEGRVLRTVSPESFREDPLRLVRGLRFISELDLDPDDETLRQMREEAPGIRLVSAERIGGGLAADGLGELSRLLLGAHPAKALRIARDTDVLVELLPEYAPAIGFEPGDGAQTVTLDEHLFLVVQAAADAGAPLTVRLAALLHDLGKPEAPGFAEHADAGARIASRILRRLRYPTLLQRHVTRLVGAHAFDVEASAVNARRFLARHGDDLALDLAEHRLADLRAKDVPSEWLDAAETFQRLLEQERRSPHRLADLAIDGGDLIANGFTEGPDLGRVLAALLERVVDEPSLNTREQLLQVAEELR